MRKRRFSSHNGNAELYDVNEQELAKDGECPHHEVTNMGAGTPKGQPAPLSFAPSATETQDEPSAVVPSSTSAPIRKEQNTAVSECTEKPTDVQEIKSEEQAQNEQFGEPSAEQLTENTQKTKKPASILSKVYTAVIVLCMLLSFTLIYFSMQNSPDEPSTDTLPQAQPPKTDESAEPDTPLTSADSVYQTALKSTVSVVSMRGGQKSYHTGFAVFDGGYIVTLYEAVGGEDISIITHDKRSFPAEVAAADASVNLALLRCDSDSLLPISTDSARAATVGESVFAIGNLGSTEYAFSLLASEVSHTERSTALTFADGISRRVQAIQLGSFGGAQVGGCPVFGKDGKALGLLFASDSERGVSLAFDICSVMPVLECMKNGEQPSAEALKLLAYTPARLGILGRQATQDGIWGVCVNGFTDDGSDAALKLREGDLIYRADEHMVADTEALAAVLEKCTKGDLLEIFILRDSQRLTFNVTLG